VKWLGRVGILDAAIGVLGRYSHCLSTTYRRGGHSRWDFAGGWILRGDEAVLLCFYGIYGDHAEVFIFGTTYATGLRLFYPTCPWHPHANHGIPTCFSVVLCCCRSAADHRRGRR